MGDRVAAVTGGKTADARPSELGRLIDAGTTELLTNQLAEVSAAMNRAHTVLAELGASTAPPAETPMSRIASRRFVEANALAMHAQ